MPTLKRTTIRAHPTNYYVGRHKNGTTPAFVQFIVIHDGETDEGATPAEGMGSWFAQDHGPGRRSSAHQGVDTDSICTYVADKDTAFGAPGVNVTGWHLEHAGRAAQTASQWDDADSRLILANGALAAAEACVRLAPLTADRKPIPAVWLTDAQLRAAQTNPLIKGFITHRQASRVLGGTHTDPGKYFPEVKYMTDVRSHLSGTLQEDDMPTPAEIAKAVLDYQIPNLVAKPNADGKFSTPTGIRPTASLRTFVQDVHRTLHTQGDVQAEHGKALAAISTALQALQANDDAAVLAAVGEVKAAIQAGNVIVTTGTVTITDQEA